MRAISRYPVLQRLFDTVGVLLVLLVASAGGADISGVDDSVPTLRFSAIPDQEETRLREKYAPVARYLESKLAVPVEYVHATRYSDAVQLFKNGDILLAWFGGLSGVQARHAVPGARAIVQGLEDPEFYSYFIAHRDAGIERSDTFPMAMRGKSFSFGAMGSTSGRLLPEWFIRQNAGASPDAFFSSVSFSGSHDQTAELVGSGQIQVGVLSYKVYERRVVEGATDPAVAKIVWVTPTYPDYNFTAHPDLERIYGEDMIVRLQRALLEMKDPALLSAFLRKGFIEAHNSDFKAIRKLALELGFIR